MNCFLCEIPKTESPEWYDRVLDRNKAAFVIPTVGGAAVGHVMVSPVAHVNAAHNLNKLQRADFIELLGRTCTRIASDVGAITVFEHSAPTDPDGRRSACIDHAHVHIAPGSYALGADPQLVDEVHSDSLPDFYNRPAPYDGYMMFTDATGAVTAARDIGRPQYLRQKVFEALGKPDEWDYAVFPNNDIIRGTIALFES